MLPFAVKVSVPSSASVGVIEPPDVVVKVTGAVTVGGVTVIESVLRT